MYVLLAHEAPLHTNVTSHSSLTSLATLSEEFTSEGCPSLKSEAVIADSALVKVAEIAQVYSCYTEECPCVIGSIAPVSLLLTGWRVLKEGSLSQTGWDVRGGDTATVSGGQERDLCSDQNVQHITCNI